MLRLYETDAAQQGIVMTTRLAQIALLVRDYDEALDFYVGKLGFARVEDSDMGDGKRWVVVSPGDGGSRFLLAKAADERQLQCVGDQGGGRVWLFLNTDDFAVDHARMSAAGVSISGRAPATSRMAASRSSRTFMVIAGT